MYNFFSLLAATADPAKSQTSIPFLIVIYGAFFAFMWFVLIRPQRKKQKAVATMQSTISIGDSVLTSGGLYGTVVDSVNDNLIVEFGVNKGVRIAVVRSSVTSVAAPNLTITKTEV